MTALAQARDSLRAFGAVVRRRDLRLLLGAYAAMSIGMWAASLAVTVYSFRVAGAQGVALQTVMALLPAAIAVPVVSGLADRYPRSRVIAVAGLLRVVITAAMIVLIVAEAPLAVVLLGSSFGGIVQGAIDPARQALLPALAERPEDLTAANVASSSIDSTSIFVGPALGGLLLAATSVEVVLVVVCAALLVAVVLVSRIRTPSALAATQTDRAEAFLRQVGAGARTVAGSPALRLLVAFMAAQTLVDGLLGVLLAVVALDLLDIGEAGLGALNSALGAGAMIGAALAITLVGRRRLAPSFAVGCVLWGVPIAVIGFVPETAVAIVALAALGVGNTLVDVSGYSLLQRAAPEDVLGRVFGVLESVMLASVALGAILAPVLISLLGLQGALIATGVLLPTLVAIGWRPLARVDAAVSATVSASDLALLRDVPMLAGLDVAALERLAAALRPVMVTTGEHVVTQGEPGEDFYIVAAGRLEVLVDGRPVREHGRGDAFGEIALLHNVPRTATIRALEAVELRALGREEFLNAISGHPESAQAAQALASSRLRFARPIAMGA